MKARKRSLRLLQAGIIAMFILSGGFTPIGRAFSGGYHGLFWALTIKYIRFYFLVTIIAGLENIYRNGFGSKRRAGIYSAAILVSMFIISVVLSN